MSSGCSLTPVNDTPVSAAQLLQNRPNPFNPRTTIRFTLDRRTALRLEIFDLRGRSLRVLCDENVKNAGAHAVVWNGADDQGRLLPSGTYVYRLRTDTESLTRRMTLLR